MKSTVKILALAVSAMALMVACKNAPEATEDTLAIDTTPIEEVVEDTMPAIDTVEVVAEPVVKKAATKKAVKKEEQKEVKSATKNGKTIVNVSANDAKVTVKVDESKSGDYKLPSKSK